MLASGPPVCSTVANLRALSPKLVTAMLDGNTGQGLIIKTLSAGNIHFNWEEQYARFLK
jgi:hypothetical protein